MRGLGGLGSPRGHFVVKKTLPHFGSQRPLNGMLFTCNVFFSCRNGGLTLAFSVSRGLKPLRMAK